MDAPVYNPAIPYVAPISGGFNPGRMLRIQGTAHPSARCFAINLQCGPNVNPRDDIVLHLSPVFSPPPRVVRNSLQSQIWGPEESHGMYYPFSPGQSWEILILSETDHFKIAINGQHFTEFYYRLPLQRVTYLAIDGETSISMLQFSGNASAPPGGYGQPYGSGVPSPQMPFPPPVGGSPYSGGGSPNPYSSPYPPPPSPAYPSQGSPYMGARAPSPNPYPMQQGYPPPPAAVVYPHSPKQGHSSGLLGAGLGAAGLGAAAGLLTGKAASKAIPIGLGVGAGTLAGAALLGGHHMKPKKMKKLFKHKHKHKWSHKWGHKWGHKHKGWGGGWGGRSSSSSD